jgi:hypothetical protein
MTRTRAALLASVCLLVGLVIGGWSAAQRVQAQSSRFGTERYGELLFIRYYNSMTGVACYVGMNGTGITEVPCDKRDVESVRR